MAAGELDGVPVAESPFEPEDVALRVLVAVELGVTSDKQLFRIT